MTRRLEQALVSQRQNTEQYNQKLDGILGITIGGDRKVEVPNRNSYVYVRLRNSQSELIQAFNNKVAPVYNLPVLVERQGNRYVVVDVDTQRYDNNWSSYSPYLPRHGNTHSFDPESGGGGDIVWVHSRQFMPLLAFPSGSVGSPNLVVAPYVLKKENGTWMYVGNTGTAGFTPYNPPNSGSAVMGLVALNTDTGNPYLIINSGSSFLDTITGTSQIYSYIPPLTNPAHIPIAAVRLVSGTSRLTWDNIYDVRQFVHPINTGSAGGLSSIAVQDEAVPQGNATTFDFAGSLVSVSISGSVARVFVTGSSGGFTGDTNAVVLTDGSGNLVTEDWLRYGVAVRPYLDLGADVTDKETNAGRIGYKVFADTHDFLHIVGAGTGVSARNVKIYDNLYVDVRSNSREFNVTDPSGQYLITGSPHVHTTEIYAALQGLPRGTMINGKINPVFTSSGIVVNLLTFAGLTPSASDPVRVRIGDTWRQVTSALSFYLQNGTNLFNVGSTELGTQEVDLFPYLIWDSNSSAVGFGASRIPFGNLVSDFTSGSTTEKHLVGFGGFTATDTVENIGRFAAQLSTGSAFTWTMPSITDATVIQRPCYETRWLNWRPVSAGLASMTVTNVTISAAKYKIIGDNLHWQLDLSAYTIGGTPSAIVYQTLPFRSAQSANLPFAGGMLATDAGGTAFGGTRLDNTTPERLAFIKYNASNYVTGSATVLVGNGFYQL